MPHTRARSVLLVSLLALVVVAFAVLASRHPFDEGPEMDEAGAVLVVQRLLEVRASKSTDPADYEPYLERASVASDLAGAAAEDTGTAIPGWKEPYLSKSEGDEAEVVVVWDAGGEPAFARASVFSLRRAGREWVVVDARTLGEDEPPPPELER